QCRKMAANRHPGPSLYVRVHPRSERSWRRENLPRMLGVSGRDRHGTILWNDPRLMETFIVRPERGADRTRHPVKHDVGEQDIAPKMLVDIPTAIAPGPKFFEDPRSKTNRRICQGIGEGLWLRPHDLRVSSLLLEPMGELPLKAFLLLITC